MHSLECTIAQISELLLIDDLELSTRCNLDDMMVKLSELDLTVGP